LCLSLEAIVAEKPPSQSREPARRRALSRSLVAGMSVLVLGIGGAAVAKTPAGQKTTASVRAAYAHVVKLRSEALQHRALPAPAPRQVVAIGNEPVEPIAVPAVPPTPAEPEATLVASNEPDSDGEVDAKDAPAAEAPVTAGVVNADVDLSEEQEVEVKGAPLAAPNDAGAESSALAKADALWDKGSKLRALSVLEHAARKTPNDAAVFKALASRAEQLAQWGDAVKAARRWVLLDPSSEARLSLARLERATGHKERAVALVDGVLKEDPTSADAKALLGEIRGQKLALSQ
jgi:tetratricopeptide (TPR) repeat protein